MTQAAVWASAIYASSRIALALWLAQLVLGRLDSRRLMQPAKIFLGFVAVTLSFLAASSRAPFTGWAAAWYSITCLAAVSTVLDLRSWLRSSERAVHQELQLDSATDRKKKSARADNAPEEGRFTIRDRVCLIGLAIAAICLALAGWRESTGGNGPAALSALHALTSSALLGFSIVLAIEVTLGGTGVGLLSLAWKRVEFEIVAIWMISMAMCAAVLAWGKSTGELEARIGPVLFCTGLLIVGYIVWSIPRRLAELAREGRMKGQVSLALAAWLAFLSLLLISGLPVVWPWQSLG